MFHSAGSVSENNANEVGLHTGSLHCAKYNAREPVCIAVRYSSSGLLRFWSSSHWCRPRVASSKSSLMRYNLSSMTSEIHSPSVLVSPSRDYAGLGNLPRWNTNPYTPTCSSRATQTRCIKPSLLLIVHSADMNQQSPSLPWRTSFAVAPPIKNSGFSKMSCARGMVSLMQRD